MEYDTEPGGQYVVYGVVVMQDGSKDRHHVCTVDVLDVAAACADNARAAFDYCYVKQFGSGTVYFSRRGEVANMPRVPPTPKMPSSDVSAAP